MASKLQFYSEFAKNSTEKLTKSRENWTEYLTTAARLYKYPFNEQVMIYAQRPDATACASFDTWHDPMNRYIKKGSKGIALVHHQNGKQQLRYVFDYADTGDGWRDPKRPFIWELKKEHEALVIDSLRKSYGDIDGRLSNIISRKGMEGTLADILHNAAYVLSEQFCHYNKQAITYGIKDSFLDGYGEEHTKVVFREALTVSIAYSLMSRCGLNPDEYFEDEDFNCIFDFNTLDSINSIGTAVSEQTEQVLREIEVVIKEYERSKITERSYEDDRLDVHAEGGLYDSQFDIEGTAGRTDRDIRADEGELPTETQQNPLQRPDTERTANHSPTGNQQISGQTAGTVDERVDGERPAPGQNGKSEGLGESHEQSETVSGENNVERSGLRLTSETISDEPVTPTYYSPEKNIAYREGDAVEGMIPHSLNFFVITKIDDDYVYCNFLHSTEKPLETRRNVFDIYLDRGQISITEPDKTLSLAKEQTGADINNEPAPLSLEEFPVPEISPEQQEYKYYSIRRPISIGTYPRETVPKEIVNFDSRQAVEDGQFEAWGYLVYPQPLTDVQISEYELKAAPISLQKEPDKNGSQIGNNLFGNQDYIPLTEIAAQSGVSLDIVDVMLRDGGNTGQSVMRIAAHYMKGADPSENIAFLMKEYGIGGKGLRINEQRYTAFFDETGITIAEGPTAVDAHRFVTLSWEQIESRIRELLYTGQYISQDNLNAVPAFERMELAEKLWLMNRDIHDEHEIFNDEVMRNTNFPDETKRVAEMLAQPEQREMIITKVNEFNAKYEQDPTIARFRIRGLPELIDRLADLRKEPVSFTAGEIPKVKCKPFVSEDDITNVLSKGSHVSGGKFRIYSFFLHEHTLKEKADFLKDEYGTGGGSHAVFGADNSYEDHDSKGISVSRGSISNPYDMVTVPWSRAARLIDELINTGRFLTIDEHIHLPDYEKTMLARYISAFYRDLPQETSRPFSVSFPIPYNEDVKAIRAMLDDPTNVDAILESMRPILEGTAPDDRYFETRHKGYADLTAFKDGTFTLFPQLSTVDKPQHSVASQPDNLFGTPPYSKMEQMNLFSIPTEEEQKTALAQAEEAHNKKQETIVTPAPVIEQADIDEAIRNWNGSIESKTLVYVYMYNNTNARARDTAELLKKEYGSNLPTFAVEKDGADSVVLPWTKVQRRIGQLMSEDKFLTPDENTQIKNDFSTMLAEIDVINNPKEEKQQPGLSDDDIQFLRSRVTITEFEQGEVVTVDSLIADAVNAQTAEPISNRAMAGKVLGATIGQRIDPITYFNQHHAKDYDFTQACMIRGYIDTAVDKTILPEKSLPENKQMPYPFPITSREWEMADSSNKEDDPHTKGMLLMRSRFAELMPVVIDGENGYEMQRFYYQKPGLPLDVYSVMAYNEVEAARMIGDIDYKITSKMPVREQPDIEHTADESITHNSNSILRDVLTNGLFTLEQEHSDPITFNKKDAISDMFDHNVKNSDLTRHLAYYSKDINANHFLESGRLISFATDSNGIKIPLPDELGADIEVSWAEIAPMCRHLYNERLDGFHSFGERSTRIDVPLPPTPYKYEKGDTVFLPDGTEKVIFNIQYAGHLIYLAPPTSADGIDRPWPLTKHYRDDFISLLESTPLNDHLKTSEPITEVETLAPEPAKGIEITKAVVDSFSSHDRLMYATDKDGGLYISNGFFLAKTQEQDINVIAEKINARRKKNKIEPQESERLLSYLENVNGSYELKQPPHEMASGKHTACFYTDGKQYFQYNKLFLDMFDNGESRFFVDDNSSYDIRSHNMIIKDKNNSIMGLILPVTLHEKTRELLADALPLEVKWKSELERIKENPTNDPYIGREFFDGVETHIVASIQNRNGSDFYVIPTVSNGEISRGASIINKSDIERNIELWESNRVFKEKQNAENEIKAAKEAEEKKEYESVNGYTDNMPPMQKANALKALNDTFHTKDYGRLSYKQFIEAAVNDGKTFEIHKSLKKKYQDMDAQEYVRDIHGYAFDNCWRKYRDVLEFKETEESPNAQWLKENHPFLHYRIFHDKSVLDNSFLVTDYRMYTSENTFYTITKTAYEYGNYLIAKAETEKHQTAEAPVVSEHPYVVGEVVHLENGRSFAVKEIGEHEVTLIDTSLDVEMTRVMSVEDFENLLRENPLNDHLFTVAANTPEQAEPYSNSPGYELGYRFVNDRLIVMNYFNYDPDEMPDILARVEPDGNIVIIDENLPEAERTEIQRVAAATDFDKLQQDDDEKWQQFSEKISEIVKTDKHHEAEKTTATPLLQGNAKWQEYQTLAAEHRDKILFTQAGDFYEVLGSDAVAVAKFLKISQSSRDVGLPERVPMCGVPNFKLDEYTDTLNKNGFEVVVKNNDGSIDIKETAKPEVDITNLVSDFSAADLKTARNDVINTLDSIFFTQHNRNGIIALLDENADNSDISLHLSKTYSGMTIIKAAPDSNVSAVTTSEGIENTLINRLITWDEIAPVVRSLGIQWKAEQEVEVSVDVSENLPTAYEKIADYVKNKLETGEKFTSADLFAEATKAYGDTMANNAFTSKDAYDAMELGVNQYILSLDNVSPEDMLTMLDLLPTQTRRTAEMEKFQQFSTPPSIAYLANWAANVNANDIMLEPSAGNGGIAVFAKKDGAKVYVNELDKRRLELVKTLPFDGFFNEDAEQINNIIGDRITPTVIVMNPPFTSSAQRNIQNGKIGAKHIEEALKILAPNGRLVAISGQGMADDAPAFRNWWREIKEQYNVKANIGIDGKNYNKYGTSFGIQMIVIDKDGATTEPVKTAFVENVLDLQKILGGIRNDRPSVQISNDSGIEQRPLTAAHLNVVAEREPEPGRNDSLSDTGGGTDTAISGDRQEQTGTSKLDTAVRGNPGITPGIANVNDNGLTPIVNGERHRGNDGRNDGDSVASRTGDTDNGQPIGSGKPRVKKELTDSIFEQYGPQSLLLENVQPHPANISESAAMSAIEPPSITYKPNLSQDLIDKGILSDVQLEAVTYAGQSHSQTLPNGYTRGFFLGDGTGVGKGRTITGVILDNYVQGRKKAVWLSENRGLVPDAKRDVTALFGNSDLVKEFEGGKKADASLSIDEGILFTTYSALSKSFDQSGSNFEKIVNWLGRDFDGVIVFDEAHNMANSIATKGTRGVKKASQRGMAGLAIQDALPNAKIVYSSATGATEVENLRYAERLGLWGEGTAFPNGDDFVHKIKAGGLAAMELIARDMKAVGVYLSRNISYEDVVYDKIVHELTPEQRQIYDELARSWQVVLQNLNKALETTNQDKDGTAKGKAYGAFWSAEQRFFNQILTAMQVPSMITDIQAQLDNNNSIVIQLVSTNEAAQEREFARLQEQGLELDDFDLTPKQMLMSYIENSFPTVQFEEYEDENGNTRSKPVYDSEGNAVINREAVRQKEMLLDKLGSIKVPSSPLDMIINHFGSDMVAENTGRKRRVVVKDGKAKEENITHKKQADVTAFQNGDKRIIIFSKAGGTGKSYHADKSAKNQQHRVHYLLQAGWQADAAVQGFGRSHRSNQVSSPTFVLVTTDLKGQMRFISTIAKRLDQLGALTKGQRQTGSQGLFTAGDNLENAFAADVLALFYKVLAQNGIRGVPDGISIIEKLGLKEKLIDEYGQINHNADELRQVNKFLNRILSLECHEQNAVFDGYAERLHIATERAMQDGTLDKGLENYRADKIVLKEANDIRVDEITGATTKYYSLTAHDKIKPLLFNQVDTSRNSFEGFYQNKNTNAVRAVFKTSSITDEHGNISNNFKLTGQDGNDYIQQDRFENNWDEITAETAEELWNNAVNELPEFRTSNLHLIGGTVLPVWDKLPTENVRIYRVLTSDGDLLIGRVIPENMIDATLERLGATREKDNIKTEDLIKGIKKGDTVYLDNGWRVTQKKVSNEQRIEIIGADYLHSDLLAKKGVFTERIGYQTRYFIPSEKDTVKIMDEIIKISPVSRVESDKERAAANSKPSLINHTRGKTAAVKMPPTPDKPSILAGVKANMELINNADKKMAVNDVSLG